MTPTTSSLERFKEKLRAWVNRHAQGPYATSFLFFFSFIESVVSPFPAEMALAPLVVVRARTWYYYASVTALASVLGGVVSYGLGALLYDAVGAFLVALYGLEDELVRTAELLSQNVFAATFFAAFTPVPWKLFALAAGLFNAPLSVFVIAAVVGRSLRFFVFGYLVHLFGDAVARLILRHFTVVTIALILLALAGAALYLL